MTDAQFIAWLREPGRARVVLVEVSPAIGGTPTLMYLSDRHYTTSAGETPAHTSYTACITGDVSISESLNIDGAASISTGDIELENSAGQRDDWLTYVWANAPVEVFMGDATWPRADFRKMFVGVVNTLESRSRDVLNLTLQDKLQRLNQPISEQLLGGGTANKDALLPLVFGEAHNISPLLVDPATLEYQAHNGQIEDVVEVRDNGDVRTVTEFLSTGKFRLSAARVGTVTCTVQGSKLGGVYLTNVAQIVQRIVLSYGNAATRFTSGDLDAANLSAFAAANPQQVAVVVASRENQLGVCQQLAASVGAQVVISSLGLLRLVKIELPAPGTAVAIGPEDYDLNNLSIAQRVPVKASVKLGYARNWTPQPTGLAAGLVDSVQNLLGREWLTVTATDATVATAYQQATEPAMRETLLIGESDAQAEASRELNLYKVQRTVFSATCGAHLLLTELGQSVTLTGSRFGLSDGKNGMVIGIVRRLLAGKIELGVLT